MVETVLHQAAREKEMVELIYLDRKGRLTQRRVRIFKWKEEGVWVYCEERKAFRRLRREGILAAERKGRR
ncbi:hypothetical protein GCM10007416_03790 [Kroppenstedtia guangzhouensis]|uniref:WYL domain-containing protein n=1 Tax=Kroppenstedtia guangzhouensis TaxID=1274356 RepID=A0ABQ1G006_9BACL|nr:hypothetical protein GCM10007416_03790 [Kroppenstedtia guangzhouensis]